MKTKEFVSHLDETAITAGIAEAERKSSGEIRVFISNKHVPDALGEAQKQFVRSGMDRTKARNGVLIYFAPRSQTFAIVGDAGIHAKAGDGLWNHIAEAMAEHLKQSDYTGAILVAVSEVGKVLAQHFPREPGDTDELSNQILRDE
ncbi:MAG: TPM domain-containing protein [Verrucomicrobiota bacterium]